MKAAFYTLGCKVNQYESQAMAQSLERRGFSIVDCNEDADIYVINSCTVTAESDRKTRQTVRHFKKLHPQSIIVLTGCMTQAAPESGNALEEADIVIGNKTNDLLFEQIDAYLNGSGRIFAVEEHKSGEPFRGDSITDFYERTRASIKIEDGCNRFCSYCIIPYARGRVRSKPLEEFRAEVRSLAEKDFCEIVLVGINLSAYGTDLGYTIVDAVREAASVEGIERVRLGSLEPDHITDEVIKGLSEIKKFCPQFHISLQSGCDKTLKKMNRHYDSAEYYELCRKLRSTFEDCSLTTDLMVGFPGETEEDFKISLDFMKKVGFEKVHVFPYSRRPGTPADRMPEQVENCEKNRRALTMIEEAEKIRLAFFEKQNGKIVEVLPEEHHEGSVRGYTANYTPVKIINCTDIPKGMIEAKIIGHENDFCIAEQIRSSQKVVAKTQE